MADPGRAVGQQAESIAAVRIDSDGDRIPDRMGDTVRVEATVLAAPFDVVPAPRARTFVGDGEAAIRVEAPDAVALAGVARGDSVEVVGVLRFVNGATTLEPVSIAHLGPGTVPAPVRVRVAELLTETHEGRLVEVSGRLIESQNVELRDGTGAIRVRARRELLDDAGLVSRLLSGRRATVVGIADQFDPSPPHDGGYRIDLLSPDAVVLRFDFRPWLAGAGLLALVGVLYGWGRAASLRAARFSALLAEKDALQEQLLQARRLESVGRLAGGVAHDFNNMLTIISGQVELALDEVPETSEMKDALTTIQQAADKSAHLTKQLLTFARRQAVTPQALDAREAVSSMTPVLRPLVREDIVIVIDADGCSWPILIDPGQFSQILTNLCANANDAVRGPGTIRITVEDRSFAGEAFGGETLYGDYVRIAVADTGSGMDSETLASVFDPFFTTKAAGKGTGLGLATVYGIVHQNGGLIDVSSRVGEGTTFELVLPRYPDGDAISDDTSHPKPSPARVAETLLLVEDEPDVLALTTSNLEALGYTVMAAKGPIEAMVVFRNHGDEIDLLVTDVIMPDMSGVELADRLREEKPGLPVLFMSGYTADVIADQTTLSSEMALLDKPFTRAQLAAKVHAVLEGSTARS